MRWPISSTEGAGAPDLREPARTAVLLVEDDPAFARGLSRLLARRGASVAVADTLDATRRLLAGGCAWDVILLDQRLPDGDAMDVLTVIDGLSPRPAVIATSAALNDAKRSLALQERGVVLLPKPFLEEDLLSAIAKARRVTSDLSRHGSTAPPSSGTRDGSGPQSPLTHGPISLELVSQTVTVGGARVELQPTQFRLLAQLLANPGRALSVPTLIEVAFRGTHHEGGGNVRYQVHELRRKLGTAGRLIETSPSGYGVGLADGARPSARPPANAPEDDG